MIGEAKRSVSSVISLVDDDAERVITSQEVHSVRRFSMLYATQNNVNECGLKTESSVIALQHFALSRTLPTSQWRQAEEWT